MSETVAFGDEARVVEDPRFRSLSLPNAALERIHAGGRWVEGPVWFGDGGFLLWSDIPNDRVMQWVEGLGAREWRRPSRFANGHARDREGRLVSCEHGSRSVTRTEHDGRVTTLVADYQGVRLNSPNDVVVKSDGTVWFTDPPYGILTDYEGERAESEIEPNVYRFDPERALLTIVASDFTCPNGLAFSPDERRLYVTDTSVSHDPQGNRHIRVFDVDERGRLHGGEVFAVVEVGCPDGLRVDERGNVWTSAGDGVRCYAPDGTRLGRIPVPEGVSNLCFGGPRANRLFITASTSVYSIFVGVRGRRG